MKSNTASFEPRLNSLPYETVHQTVANHPQIGAQGKKTHQQKIIGTFKASQGNTLKQPTNKRG
ncbi:hypothetical protein ACO0LC_05160 [Undibacterium sp. JH2W]